MASVYNLNLCFKLLYGVAGTLPVSTAGVERLFSSMKLLYTDTRLHVSTANRLLMHGKTEWANQGQLPLPQGCPGLVWSQKAPLPTEIKFINQNLMGLSCVL